EVWLTTMRMPSQGRNFVTMAANTNREATNVPGSSADGVAWNLNDLYSGLEDDRITQDLDKAMSRAEAFEAAYRDKINVEGGPSADLLLAAVRELESLAEQ